VPVSMSALLERLSRRRSQQLTSQVQTDQNLRDVASGSEFRGQGGRTCYAPIF
jgi:hypothetical protein